MCLYRDALATSTPQRSGVQAAAVESNSIYSSVNKRPSQGKSTEGVTLGATTVVKKGQGKWEGGCGVLKGQ